MTSNALKLKTKFLNIAQKVLQDLVPPALFLIIFPPPQNFTLAIPFVGMLYWLPTPTTFTLMLSTHFQSES